MILTFIPIDIWVGSLSSTKKIDEHSATYLPIIWGKEFGFSLSYHDWSYHSLRSQQISEGLWLGLLSYMISICPMYSKLPCMLFSKGLYHFTILLSMHKGWSCFMHLPVLRMSILLNSGHFNWCVLFPNDSLITWTYFHVLILLFI